MTHNQLTIECQLKLPISEWTAVWKKHKIVTRVPHITIISYKILHDFVRFCSVYMYLKKFSKISTVWLGKILSGRPLKNKYIFNEKNFINMSIILFGRPSKFCSFAFIRNSPNFCCMTNSDFDLMSEQKSSSFALKTIKTFSD